MRCTCGIPNRANYYLHVVWNLEDECTGETDVYLCDEHAPNIAEGAHGAFDEPRMFGLSATTDAIRHTLQWDGSDDADVLEYTLTEIR